MIVQRFQKVVLDFYKKHARSDLPWRKTRDPWAILVSEVMLQQTQVSRVKEKFGEFMKMFPAPEALARASTKSVLRAWQGLGYNRRALNLQKAARDIVERFHERVPADPEDLQELAGIGHYTANAVAAFAFNKPVVFLDTNIRRVYLYHFFSSSSSRHPKLGKPRSEPQGSPTGDLGSRNKQQKETHSVIASASEAISFVTSEQDRHASPGLLRDDTDVKVSDSAIFPLIQKTLYRKSPRLWYSALMDYGALGEFGENPNRTSKHYVKQSKFFGSRRFVRAKIVAYLLASRRSMGVQEIQKHLQGFAGLKRYAEVKEVEGILRGLEREGFLKRSRLWRIAR